MKNIDKAYLKQYKQLDLSFYFDDCQEEENKKQDSLFGLKFNPFFKFQSK